MYRISIQEERDSDKIENEVRQALGSPPRHLETYRGLANNPLYIEIGDVWLAKYKNILKWKWK